MGHPKRVNVYTDHRNLKPILEAGLNPNKIHLQRLNRWGMLIQNADLNIFHISSVENALADLFTRWGAVEDTALPNKLEPPDITHFSQLPIMQPRLGENIEIQQVKKDKEDKTKINNLQLNMPAHEDDIISTDSSDSELPDHTENNQIVEDIFPSIAPETKAMLKRLEQDRISYLNPFYVGARQRDIYKEILKMQQETGLIKKNILVLSRDDSGRIIIPTAMTDRVLVFIHISRVHPSYSQEIQLLRERFSFQMDHDDFRMLHDKLRNSCLHCHRRPSILPRPLHLTHLAKNCREIIHADYLYVNKWGYLLVVVDSLSRKLL